MKKVLIIVVLLALGGFFFMLSRESKPNVSIPTLPVVTPQPGTLCYYRSEKTANGLYDRAWMKIVIDGTAVSGEFRNLPAEKDSRVGTFSGTRGQSSLGEHSTTVVTTWNAQAEGIQNKEELLIAFGDIKAEVAFGEMIKSANGVYVYKDRGAAVYQPPMSSIDCATLDETIAVESYIQAADIAALLKEKPVLGGTFFVTSIVVDATTDTAAISYEDGHIAGTGVLSYTYDRTTKRVTVNSFSKTQ